MLYFLTTTESHKRVVSSNHMTFMSPRQVANYIRDYIDQPYIQALLSEIEYAELDEPKDDFLPLPEDIDAACDAAHNNTAVVFEAGENVGSASLFGVVFTVTRKHTLS